MRTSIMPTTRGEYFDWAEAFRRPAIASARRRKFRNRYTGFTLVEHHLDPHVAAHLVRSNANDVGDEPRAFVEFHDRNNIGHLVLEPPMIDAVIDDEAVEAPLSARFAPDEIRGEAMGAALRWGKPEPVADVAQRQQQASRLGTFPEGKRFGARVRNGLPNLGVRRFRVHHALA